MSLLLNMLSRLVIAFLPRSKCLLISWLQSRSAVILEPKKIKSVTVSIVSPSICHEVLTQWTVGHQAPLSMGFSGQDCWSGLPFPPPGHLPDPGIEPTSLTSPALAGGFFTTSTTIHNMKWSRGTGKDWTNYGMLSYINHPYLYIQNIYHRHWTIIIYRPLRSCLL